MESIFQENLLLNTYPPGETPEYDSEAEELMFNYQYRFFQFKVFFVWNVF